MRQTRTRRAPVEEQKKKDREEKMSVYLEQLDDKRKYQRRLVNNREQSEMKQTRTRRAPVEERKKKDREEKMSAYLEQLDDKLENDIKSMSKMIEFMCDGIRKIYSIQVLGLPKWLLESTLEEIFERQELSKVEVEEEANTKKSRLQKVCATKSKIKSARKTQMKDVSQFQMPMLNAAVGFNNLFAPKFDPRVPITSATGLRLIKPGEKFVMMSISGSPLIAEANSVPAVVSLEDGKTIAIPFDVNEDTKSKVAYTQKIIAAMNCSSR